MTDGSTLNLPHLQQLAPSVYTAAQSAAIAARVPVVTDEYVDRSNGTLQTFAVRTMAQLISLGSSIAGSFQSLTGEDNSEMLQQIEDAQLILRHTGYDTASGGIVAQIRLALDKR